MDRKEYQKKMEAQLKLWEAEIDKLQAKASHMEAETRQFYLKQIQELYAQQKVAREKLHELVQASDNAWMSLRVGIEEIWNNFGDAVKSAMSKFK